ncbi:Unannotated [Lentimonas sp. CC19]|nr:Unannotated [Lentimonas sp. CC10]CAA6697066.1 Unannotated [Lentimonas sp. CC19]CAA7069115.1 Unannotated [Lentimonas sp. CC11]
MDTVKVLDDKNDPVSDVTVSRVHFTRSMLPEEAITDQDGIAKFEYKMCISEDFNCWISRQEETSTSKQFELFQTTGTTYVSPRISGYNKYTIEEDSSLAFIIDSKFTK